MESGSRSGSSPASKSVRSGGSKLNLEDLESLNATLKESLGDRYEVTAQLGSGAFGEVYKARDTLLDRDVAIKRVRLDKIASQANREEVRQRFLREARVAARLNHPNIVTLHDIVDRANVSLIVMEFVDGTTLEEELNRKKRLSLEETVAILSQAADGLEHAHKQTVVHRDVKPANIMIERSGRVKVTDFGLAKSETSSDITTAGMILGTPNYMSPEQAGGETHVDARSDVFSLGAIVYECLAGEQPFRAKSTVATLLKIVKGDPPRLECERLGLPPAVADVLNRALAKAPGDRFASAGEMIRALRAARKEETLERPVPAPPPKASQFDPDLCGRLSTTPLAEVIRSIYVQRKTGVLHLEREGERKRIHFQKGTIVFASSDVNDDHLGELLMRRGEIDRGSFEEAARLMRQTRERLGATLVDLGYLSRETIEERVAEQFETILHSLFDWEAGEYGFEILEEVGKEDIVVRLSTAETILEGIRRMSSPERIRGALGRLDRVLVHSENPLLLYQKIRLSPEEGFILSRVDGTTTVAEIAALSPLGEEKTLQCTYGLVSAGVLEIQSNSGSRVSRIEKVEATQIPKPDVDVGKQEERIRDSVPSLAIKALREEIAGKHASLSRATFYELLEIQPNASESEIKKAYYVSVKKYHPDRHHSPHLKDLRGLLEEILGKMTAAYEILREPSERERYDSRILRRSGAPTPSQASTPSIESPDGSSDSRLDPKELAEKHFREGEHRYQEMAYHDAILCFREAVRLDPKGAPYHRYLAMSLAKNPNWRKEAEEHYQEAIRIDALDVESYRGLIEIYESLGMKTRLMKMYEKLREVDPENARLQETSPEKSRPQSKLKRLFQKN